ncbi:MAG: TSUP family transporter [Actinobacteria bacterium]|nr:TSUP family transporter [Actinomycetota bacterium]
MARDRGDPARASGRISMELAVILIAMAIGALIKGVTGAGLPQIAIPVIATFLGVEAAVVIMSIPGVLTNTWLLAQHRHYRTEARDLPWLLVMGTIGAVVGTWLLKSLDERILSLILAGVIFLYITVFLSKPHLSLPAHVTRFTSPLVGSVAGLLQGSTGMSGPVLITYLHSFRMRREAYVFALTLLFQVYALIQTITLVWVGLYTQTRLVYSLLSLIPIMLFMRGGVELGKKLSRRTFEYAILVVMFATAVKLIYDGLFA